MLIEFRTSRKCLLALCARTIKMESVLLTCLIFFGVLLSANAQFYVSQVGNLGYGGLGGFGQSAGYGYNNKYGVGGVGATGTNSYSSGIIPFFPLPIPVPVPPPPIPYPPPGPCCGGPAYRSGEVPPGASVASASSAANAGVVPSTVNSQPLSSRMASSWPSVSNATDETAAARFSRRRRK